MYNILYMVWLHFNESLVKQVYRVRGYTGALEDCGDSKRTGHGSTGTGVSLVTNMLSNLPQLTHKASQHQKRVATAQHRRGTIKSTMPKCLLKPHNWRTQDPPSHRVHERQRAHQQTRSTTTHREGQWKPPQEHSTSFTPIKTDS